MKVKKRAIFEQPPTWTIPETHDEQFAQFADSRNLPANLLSQHGVHVSDNTRPGWIAIPYPHLSGIWHTRYRAPLGHDGPKYWQPKGTSVHLYNPLHLGPNADEVWFAEGEMDTLTLIAADLPAIGIPGASSAKNVFASEWKLLFDTATIVVAFDNDDAGQKAGLRVAAAFAPHSHIFNRYPDGMNDWNEWWVDDADGMRQTLRRFREENGL